MDPSIYWDPAQHATQIQLDQRANPPPVDDWQKDRPATHSAQQAQPNPLPSPTLASAAIDMDMGILTDLAGPTANLLATNHFYPQHYAQHLWPSPGYTTMSYTQWSTNPVPVSSYSSLNGANTATPSLTSTPSSQLSSQPSQSQQQQQQQPPQQPQQPPPSQPSTSMMIDTTNGTQTFSRSSFVPSPTTQTALGTQRQNYYPFYSYYQQPASTPQGTLSPQALHSPSNPILALSPSAFYAPLTANTTPQSQPAPQPTSQTQLQQVAPSPVSSAPTPETLSPEERKKQFNAALQTLLQPTAFTGAKAVLTLCNRINEYGMLEVDKKTRLDILSKMRDGAGNPYYRAWSESVSAMTITRDWLKEAAKDVDTWLETIMPLLQLIDRLPFNIDTLTMSKLGKIIRALIKDEPTPAIKDMASNLERRWRDLISAAQTDKKDPESKGEDGKAKKRKPDSSASLKSDGPPAKKAALSSSVKPSATQVKKEAKPGAPTGKDAKADSSFFSAPKAKAKLPTFKKAPPPQIKKEDNVAQPSSYDPFQDVLKSLKTTRKESPAVSTPPPTTGASSTPTSTTGMTGKNTSGKKKSVSWASDDKLEEIRWIEKAIYDDDPVDGMHLSQNLRDMDRGEGAALHTHLFEEVIDWSEPQLLELGLDPERPPRGSQSTEKDVQEQREQTELIAVYMTPSQIPDSPGEPLSTLSEEETDKGVTTMTVGAQADPIFWNDDHGSAAPTGASVADLVSQLAAAASAVPTDPSPMILDTPVSAPGVGGSLFGSIDFSTIPAEQLQQLLQLSQLATATTAAMGGAPPLPTGPAAAAAAGVPPTVTGAGVGWPTAVVPPAAVVNGGAAAGGHFAAEYGQVAYHEDSDQMRWGGSHPDGGNVNNRGRGVGGFRGRARGRGGHGGGRGGDDGGYRVYKRKPCNFFAQGRCKFGDLCDFSHDPADHPQLLGM